MEVKVELKKGISLRQYVKFVVRLLSRYSAAAAVCRRNRDVVDTTA